MFKAKQNFRCQPVIKEVRIDNSFKLKDVFNDTSFHFFQKSDLAELEPEFFNKTIRKTINTDPEFKHQQ